MFRLWCRVLCGWLLSGSLLLAGENVPAQLDIDRNRRLLDATQSQIFGGVDSAYVMVNSNLISVRPHLLVAPNHLNLLRAYGTVAAPWNRTVGREAIP